MASRFTALRRVVVAPKGKLARWGVGNPASFNLQDLSGSLRDTTMVHLPPRRKTEPLRERPISWRR